MKGMYVQNVEWHHRSPRVYRYLESRFVDEFFHNGTLMLSSFARFARHADEQRLDAHEGKTHLIHRTEENGGQTLHIQASFGHDAYVLCGSLLPSIDLMSKFGADSAIVIKDVAGFCKAIAKVLIGFRRGVDGPCSYQLRRIIEQDLGWLDFGPQEEGQELSKFNLNVLNSALTKLVSSDVYFLKHHSYVAQAEWRLVWTMDHQVAENLTITVPEARQFCTRWEGQGDVIAFGCGRN